MTSSKASATITDSTPPYHHGNLRAGLLDLAEERIEQSGVAGLSLRELARDIGVSHGAPRTHFPDKQALLDALAIRGLETLGRELGADPGLRRGSFDRRLLAFARVYVRFATQHPTLLGLMFARKEGPGAVAIRAANDRAFAVPQALIADATAAGEIVGDDPDRTAMAVLATVQGLASIITSGMINDRPVERVITGTVETLISGLRTRPGAAARTGAGTKRRN